MLGQLFLPTSLEMRVSAFSPTPGPASFLTPLNFSLYIENMGKGEIRGCNN